MGAGLDGQHVEVEDAQATEVLEQGERTSDRRPGPVVRARATGDRGFEEADLEIDLGEQREQRLEAL